jgi:hypothetical protein
MGTVDEGTLTDIRKAAKKIIDTNVPVGTRYTSDGPTKDTFTRLTGGKPADYPSRHDKLVAVWAKGSKETCCMDFVGWYSGQLAAALGKTMTENLGRFTINKGVAVAAAWIPTTAAAKPKYGDILLHTGIHIDVAIGFDGPKLCRVAAGQGIVGQRDVLTRVTGGSAYNYQKLQGWVDIDIYFGGAAAPGPTPTSTMPPPPWIYGWWQVAWQGQQFGYYFYRDGTVKWTRNLGQPLAYPPGGTEGTGRFGRDATGAIVIYWESGSVETFPRGGPSGLQGTWRGADGNQSPLSGVKLDDSRVIA